jgi:hypothetical protein
MEYCARTVADNLGQFRFPPQENSFRLIVTHASGYALIKSDSDWDLMRILHLRPWAKVEGDFRIGQSPVANATIAINLDRCPHSLGDDGPDFVAQCVTTTGPGGRFVFDRIIPGRGRVGLCGAPHTQCSAIAMDPLCLVNTIFAGGQTLVIGLEGIGCRVGGKLLPPKGFNEPIYWGLAQVTVQREASGKLDDSLQWKATVDRDGRFRIDGMPPGNFSLRVCFQQNHQGRLWDYRFKIDSPYGDLTVEQVDLGALRLSGR